MAVAEHPDGDRTNARSQPHAAARRTAYAHSLEIYRFQVPSVCSYSKNGACQLM